MPMSRDDIRLENDKLQARYREYMSIHDQRRFEASLVDYREFRYRRVLELSVSTQEGASRSGEMYDQMLKAMVALWNISMPLSLLVSHRGEEVSLWFGTPADPELLRHTLEGSIAGIGLSDEAQPITAVVGPGFTCAGFFAGDPSVKSFDDIGPDRSPLDDLISGTRGINWLMSFYLEPVPHGETLENHNAWLNRATHSSEFITASFNSSSGIAGESLSTEKTFVGARLYNQFAESMSQVLEESLKYGQWNVTAACFTENGADLALVGGLFSSQLRASREETQRPYSFSFYPMAVEGVLNPCTKLRGVGQGISKMSSCETAAMCSLPVWDTFGLRIRDRVSFDVSQSHEGELVIGQVKDVDRVTEHIYSIDPASLNRHALILGLTGGGKSNTVKSLIYAISTLDEPLPFLMIEPAKKEYYELYKLGMRDLQVYSVGSPEGCTFKINPFECMEGIPLQSHIDAVFAAFKASFILYSPMPYVLETAIYEIYKDAGWDIETGENVRGQRLFPTIEDLYHKIAPVVKDMGYDKKMQNDLIGSLTSRINSLRMGAKGAAVNVARSMPLKDLLQGRVVIELDDIGDEDAKAFIISLILMQLQECRRSETQQYQLSIRHLLFIEEAHRLLKNISSGTGENADPRGAAVEYFCNMLAELRSKGQGFVVIDQIPSKLAPDLVKNTNLKIVHRTVDREDRELMGGAMHMTEDQTEFLACLPQGTAAVYSEGDNRPKLVKMPYAGAYEDQSGLSHLTRQDILAETRKNSIVPADSPAYGNQARVDPICYGCPGHYSCIAAGRTFEDCISARMPDQTSRAQVLAQLGGMKKAEDVCLFCKREFSGILSGERGRLTNCLMAWWFAQKEHRMDTKIRKQFIEYLQEHLEKRR